MATKYEVNPRMLSPAALAKQKHVGAERHTIEWVDFDPEVDELECSCGEWRGPALDLAPFRAHRREAGMLSR